MPRTNARPDLEKKALLGLLSAADRTKRYFSELLRPTGLTLQQYNVLRILRGAGPEALPTLEIGERMLEKTPGVSRLLDRLEARGLVERRRCDEDRRRVLCSLTDEAASILADLDDPIDRADADCFTHLSDSELRRLVAMTARVST